MTVGDGIDVRFGRALRHYREAAGLSQMALAHEAGVDRSYVGQVERAEKCPTLIVAQALALALHVPLSEIIRAAEEAG